MILLKSTKKMINDVNITEEKLNELQKKTKDKFTKLLINNLKRRLYSIREIGLYEKHDFERILNLVDKEEKRNRLRKSRKIENNITNVELKVVTRSGKKREINVKGDITLSNLSQLIQQEFDLEPLHLYEFEIGKLKFGPKCDEWQEIFDGLDNFKLGYILSFVGLKNGDSFKFRYDFGENIKFKIEITDIKDINSKNE